MRLKAFDIMTILPVLLGKSLSTCFRMQRRVNRQHNSLTVDVVKRSEFDR